MAFNDLNHAHSSRDPSREPFRDRMHYLEHRVRPKRSTLSTTERREFDDALDHLHESCRRKSISSEELSIVQEYSKLVMFTMAGIPLAIAAFATAAVTPPLWPYTVQAAILGTVVEKINMIFKEIPNAQQSAAIATQTYNGRRQTYDFLKASYFGFATRMSGMVCNGKGIETAAASEQSAEEVSCTEKSTE